MNYTTLVLAVFDEDSDTDFRNEGWRSDWVDALRVQTVEEHNSKWIPMYDANGDSIKGSLLAWREERDADGELKRMWALYRMDGESLARAEKPVRARLETDKDLMFGIPVLIEDEA